MWNGKLIGIKGTILEDLINGFWKVSEDIYYDNIASQLDDMKYVDETPYNDAWYYNDQDGDSDQLIWEQ